MIKETRTHHKKVIDMVSERVRKDPRYRALIINGSIARGSSRANSDIDAVFVTTEREFRNREKHKRFRDMTFDLGEAAYPGGYVDGIVVTYKHLQALEESGSEPARAFYQRAYVAYSEIEGLAALVERIPVYPRMEKEAKIRSFSCQVVCAGYSIRKARDTKNDFLLSYSINRLIFFAQRLILAHNEILYISPPELRNGIRKARRKPRSLSDRIEYLLKNPTVENADRFVDSMKAYIDCGVEDPWSVWIEDVYWDWWRGRVSVENS